MIRKCLLWACCLLAATATLRAQSAVAQLTGQVTDPSGAVVINATVTVTNVATGIRLETSANGEGYYSFPVLQPGQYKLSVESQGFRPVTQSGIILRVNQSARIDVKLEVGQTTEAITVEAPTPMINAENVSVGAVIDSKKIVEMPLNGRSFMDLALLTPGVARAGGAQGQWALTVAGGRPQNNNFLLDGTQNTDGDFNKAVVSPSIDLIQEFKVQTSSYSAEFGRAGAGQINVVTRSGGNDVHGTAYEFFRNSAMDARQFTSPSKLPYFNRHQFGATAGGPVIRNRTFFFVNYEGVRRVQGQSAIGSVPVPALRDGDFSGLAVVYDPDTARANPNYNPAQPVTSANSQLLRDPFPNNRIPSNRVNPITSQVLATVPLPNRPGQVSNYLDTRAGRETDNQYSIRLDHQLTSKNNVFGRYSANDNNSYSPNQFPGFGTTFLSDPKNLTLSDVHTFGPTLFNEFKFGVVRFYESDLQDNAYGKDWIAQLGIQGVGFGGEAARGLPQFSVQNYSTFGDGTFALPRLLRNTTFQWLDNLTWIKGRHTAKFDFEARRFRYNLQAWYQSRGYFQFTDGFTTRTATSDGTGNAMAAYLLGLPVFSQRQVGQTLIDTRSTSIAGYAQDDFKVSPRLTFNLGLRYELSTPLADTRGALPNADLSKLTNGLPTIYIGGQLGYPAGLVYTDKNNWAPRVGLAYRPFNTDTTVVRAGFGIFYGVDDGNTYFNNVRAVPSIIPHTIQSDNYVPQIFEIGFSQPARLGDPNLITTYGPIDINLRTGYVQQWSLNIQHQIHRWVIDTGYSGNAGKKLQRSRQLNAAMPGPGAIQPRRPYQAFYLADGLTLPVQFDLVSRVIPIGAAQMLENSASSSYNGLQVRVERPYQNGFTVIGTYTWSKALTDAPSFRSAGNEPDTTLDPRNLRLEWGRMAWDIRQRGVLGFVYELPFGHGKRYLNRTGVLDVVLGGWQVNGIWALQTGAPFTINVSTDTANIGSTNGSVNRGNVVPGQAVYLAADKRSTARWFNTAAFSAPPAYTFGNAGRNTVTGPGQLTADTSASKTTRLTERVGLQLRFEAFNLVNHPNYGTPNRSVNSLQFGSITSQVGSARQLQLGGKVVF